MLTVGRRRGINCGLQCQSDALCKPTHPPPRCRRPLFFCISTKCATRRSAVIMCSTTTGCLSGNINTDPFTAKTQIAASVLTYQAIFQLLSWLGHPLTFQPAVNCHFDYFRHLHTKLTTRPSARLDSSVPFRRPISTALCFLHI